MRTKRSALRALERGAAMRGGRRHQVWQLVTLYRVAALVVAGAALLSDGPAMAGPVRGSWLAFAVLAAAAIALHRFGDRIPAAALIVAETVAAAALIAAAPTEASVLALYLLVPAFWAGVVLRPIATVATVAAGSSIALGLDVAIGTWGQGAAPVHWVILTLASAALGAWSATLQRKRSSEEADYERTLALLLQLGQITRRLPVGLDRLAALNRSLESVRDVRPDADVWIYGSATDSPGPELSTADDAGVIAVPGSPEWADAKQRRRPTTVRPQTDRELHLALVPLVHREAVVGMVRIAVPTPIAKSEMRAIQARLATVPVQLIASSAFNRIRESAIAEERSRLSRQIHDGVAQDLAGLAYVLDGLAHDVPESGEREALAKSASEVRRLVEELRFSIFDLRTGMGSEDRFGTALATYVHQIGERAGMRVQVEIDDVAADVPRHTAHELLRIAQEAITNARRHAHARSLWVVLRVNADGLLLRVADDGGGMEVRGGQRAGDGVGMSIMAERADRLGGRLSVRPRVGGGTVVECYLASPSIAGPNGHRQNTATGDSLTPSRRARAVAVA